MAMAIYYAIVTPLNFTLPPIAVAPMFACTSLSALLSATLWFVWGRGAASTARLERLAATTNLVLLFNVMLHTFLVRDAHLLIYFAPISLIFSIVGPTYRVIYPSLAAAALCAAACAHFMPQAYRSEFAFALVTILGAALGVATLLHRAIRGEARALAEATAAAIALDDARRRSDRLAAEAEAAHAAKASFVANMSHEIRNPLGGMLGLIAALARTELDPDQAQSVALLESSGQMLKRIVSDVLDMEKLEAGKVELEVAPLSLSEEIGGVVRLMSAQARDKGLDLVFEDMDPAAPPVAGDPTRIKQIVVNLVSNAIKFTGKGGVTVRLRATPTPDASSVRVAIEVADTGIGFDVDNAPWLFERFGQAGASTARTFGGTGLGLAICRALARQMGGDVSATSVVGQGSCFSVRLVLPVAAPAAFAAVAASAPISGVSLSVLLAEDNAANRRVIRLLLEQAGVETVAVDNGRAAVEARRANDFDVILMDMHMPELDGLQAIREIRSFERESGSAAVPVVMLTGRAADEDRAAAAAAGAQGFVTKPITPEALYAALDRVSRPLSGAAQI